jgi:ABC-type branched-subunit amino acid transport system substrate-binding protein
VAILLPLSGRLADIGGPMLKAAQLSLSVPGSPDLLVKDTAGSPEQAAQMAREAIAEGAKMILGPVTSPETAQVGQIARTAGIPVLAFTNDQTVSQPGVWTLGITPSQQVRRLVEAVKAANHGPILGLLPDDDFGHAMADELTRLTAADGGQPAAVRFHGAGDQAVRSVVNDVMSEVLPGETPPFNAILLGTYGKDLKSFADAFAQAHINRAKVQILGPGLWSDPASGSSVMQGAWFPVPDPDARRDMMQKYQARYREPAPPRADLAHDAASIARVLAARGRMSIDALTQPAGFTGVDGWFSLRPDGQVLRGLALFRIDSGKITKIGAAATGPAPSDQ